MIYSNNPPFIFIHIPKTAGTSFEEALYHYQDFTIHDEEIHQPLIQYRDYLTREEFDDHFKFCIVRNPFDLMYSSWLYWTNGSEFKIPFEEWVIWRHEGRMMEGLKFVEDDSDDLDKSGKLQISWYMNRAPQTYWFLDEDGNFLADYIVSFEYLQEGFNEIVEHLGLTDVYLPHANKGRESYDRDYRKYYTERTRKIIEERYWMDLKLFGYEFDELLPNKEKFGFVNPEKNSLKKNGINYEGSFYINHASMPYGFHTGLRRHTTGDDFEEQLRSFETRKLEKRFNSLNHNIGNIERNIHEMEDTLFNSDDDFDTTDLEILIIEERQKELMFKLKARKIRQELENR